MTAEYYTDDELNQFKRVQRVAYNAVLDVERELRVGMTEIQAAQLIEAHLEDIGVTQYFHKGFAWFGDRTGFKNFNRPFYLKEKFFPLPHLGREFMPSHRKLEKGMAVILDVAPALEGCAADIGYSFSFGENKRVNKARSDLKKFRDIIPGLVLKGMTLGEIYQRTHKMILDMGYRNCHSIYPLGVLGHKVGKIPTFNAGKLSLMGFQPQSYLYLAKQGLKNILFNTANGIPFWTEDADMPPEPGLWAIEPHMGNDEFGVKFEEILVVTDNDAYWLDDNLPHVKFWKAKSKTVRRKSQPNRHAIL